MRIIQFFKKSFSDMKESAKEQRKVDKANFEAVKLESKARFQEAKLKSSLSFRKQNERAKQEAALNAANEKIAALSARVKALENGTK